MKVCITEKPSVARDIARILGAGDRHDGYYEGNGYRVTWTFGHLCTLKEPADYTPRWKQWSLGALPMIPERFGIKVIDDAGILRQFKVIEDLIKEADEVINCGDAGQEGELIQRWVMQKAGIACPVKRLWISSLTDESIRNGFGDLQPSQRYDNLYHAGLSRAIGDWVLGLNATRLYSLKYSSPGHVLSVGRVQTPTLAMIVNRQREIEAFKSADFWELVTLYRDVQFTATIGRIGTQEEAAALLDAVKDHALCITEVVEKNARESAPRLFDLTSLQVECNKAWGWTAEETLRRIQSLYEKKVTTYPRVDTTYLSTDLYPRIPHILERMTPYAAIIAPLLEKPLTRTTRIFDNAKVTDHHAIIPTGESPRVLEGEERKLYHLIATRFIAAFYPDCVYATTTVMARAGDIDFKALGKVIVEPGWRAVLGNNDADQGDDQGARLLPPMTVGESGPHAPKLVKKATQPPKPYTEATLLRAMESAGKQVDDEQLREAMKENGIGRPSTRAQIIETLFKRRYIYRKRKAIIATEAGLQLVDTINQELLKSPKLTGIWENKLRRIERGEFSAADFISQLKELIGEIVINVLSDNSNLHINVEDAKPSRKSSQGKTSPDKSSQGKTSPDKSSQGNSSQETTVASKPQRKPSPKKYEDIPCPRCGNGYMRKGRSAYGCSNYGECGFVLPFEQHGDSLTPARLNTLINKKFR